MLEIDCMLVWCYSETTGRWAFYVEYPGGYELELVEYPDGVLVYPKWNEWNEEWDEVELKA